MCWFSDMLVPLSCLPWMWFCHWCSLCWTPQNGSTWLGHSLQQTGQPVFIICQSATSWGSSLDWFRISCSFESLTRSLKKHMYLNKRVQIYNCIFFYIFLDRCPNNKEHFSRSRNVPSRTNNCKALQVFNYIVIETYSRTFLIKDLHWFTEVREDKQV